MAGSKIDYINYRIERAYEALNDARYLAEKESWNATVNRLYYACFYAVTALLLNNNLDTKTHSGAKRRFGLHFVNTGLISMRFNELYSDLMDYRQKGDYSDFMDNDRDNVLPLINPVEEFINTIKQMIPADVS